MVESAFRVFVPEESTFSVLVSEGDGLRRFQVKGAAYLG